MIYLLVIVALSLISTILVIAAGMLSSRLNQQESLNEVYSEGYEENASLPSDTLPRTID